MGSGFKSRGVHQGEKPPAHSNVGRRLFCCLPTVSTDALLMSGPVHFSAAMAGAQKRRGPDLNKLGTRRGSIGAA